MTLVVTSQFHDPLGTELLELGTELSSAQAAIVAEDPELSRRVVKRADGDVADAPAPAAKAEYSSAKTTSPTIEKE